MKKLTKCYGAPFVALLGGVLIFALVVSPVFAQRTTPERKLQLAEDLAGRAAKRAAEANQTGDTRMVQEVLDMTREALFLVSEVAAEAETTGNEELAKDSYKATDKVVAALFNVSKTCLSCAETAVEPAAAPCCCDCGQGRQLLELAYKVTALISGGVDWAEETEDDELVQLGYDMANKAGKALALLNEAWTHCAKAVADAGAVSCCRENSTQVEGIAGLLDRAKRETVALGAEPEVPRLASRSFIRAMRRPSGIMNNRLRVPYGLRHISSLESISRIWIGVQIPAKRWDFLLIAWINVLSKARGKNAM